MLPGTSSRPLSRIRTKVTLVTRRIVGAEGASRKRFNSKSCIESANLRGADKFPQQNALVFVMVFRDLRVPHTGDWTSRSRNGHDAHLTKNLELVPMTIDEARAMVDAMSPAEKEQLSADWLPRLAAGKSNDPWTYGFSLVQRGIKTMVGKSGFKGPPTPDGVVEIAYGIFAEHQGKGYATEATQALVWIALNSGQVRIVRAHTLPESNASMPVLIKCGFRKIGEVIDPKTALYGDGREGLNPPERGERVSPSRRDRTWLCCP